ncbi:MAG TPA: KH domain-containing protein [Pyrinomonadaceae bacterium]|nr:KH domain-containing protein [Pyrinomonadaceae bacterium]
MKEAVEKIVRSLVGNPDEVEITEQSDGGKVVKFGVRVARDDFGRLIGREGRTIKAIRSILYFGGLKHGKRYHLDLIED